MTYKLSSPGWLSQVFGIKVVKVALSNTMVSHAGEFFAHHLIEHHRQQGDGGDILGTQNARGYPICNWNIANDGTIRQYLTFYRAAWHGDSVSHYAWGVEHAGFTGKPETEAQLRSSEALSAALIELTED